MRVGKMLVAAAAVGALSSAANAALTASWVNVPNGGISDGSGANLAGSQTFDLIANLDVGDDFQSMRIFSDPPAATTFFQHSFGSGGPNHGPPNTALIPAFPALAFDSYFDDNGNFTVLGSTDGTNDLPPPGIFSTTDIAVAGGDLISVTTGGPLRLMRLTFFGPTPDFLGRIFSLQNSVGIPVPQIGGGGVIPEPATLGLLAGAGLLGLRRRSA